MKTKHSSKMQSRELLDRLARRGSRMTRQKQVVLDALRSCPGHPDALSIYDRARRRLPNISLGTVYRNLAVLRDAGIIQELRFGKTQGRFEEVGVPHHHVLCTECGRIDDFPSGSFDLTDKASRETDFEIQGQRLEFFGLCPKCRTKPSSA